MRIFALPVPLAGERGRYSARTNGTKEGDRPREAATQTGLGGLNPFDIKGGEGDRPEEAATRTPQPQAHPWGPPLYPTLLTDCQLSSRVMLGSPLHDGAAMKPWPPTRLWVGRPKGLVTPSYIPLCLERQGWDVWVAGKPNETL